MAYEFIFNEHPLKIMLFGSKTYFFYIYLFFYVV